MKHRIREKILARRSAHHPHHAESKSARINERLLALPEIRAAGTVMLYYPLTQEVDCLRAAEGLLAKGKIIAFPRMETGRIVPVAVKSFNGFVKGGMGVMEPARGKRIALKSIDAVVVPGVAFDLRRHRLGFGGGHYDRFLKTVRKNCFKAGLAFELQLVNKLPAQSHDVPMDAVVTEKREIREHG
ncbi:MAG: 5-formyltetrahydrofolate cyclo-ligase [Candidatus Micrarchaeota archaeon]